MTALAWLLLTAMWGAIAYIHGRDTGREQMARHHSEEEP